MKLPRLRVRSRPPQQEEQKAAPPAEPVKFGALRYERQQPSSPVQNPPALPRRSASEGRPAPRQSGFAPLPRRSQSVGGPLPRRLARRSLGEGGSVVARSAGPPRPQARPQPSRPLQTAPPLRASSSAAPARRAVAHQRVEQTKQRLHQHEANQRFPHSAEASRGRQHEDERIQHELRELHETHDLHEVDDDVEDVATLAQWRALEHNHRPKSPAWYAVLAASITIVSVGFLLFGNIIGAITIALAGGMVYYIAQQEPKVVRYRLMTEGVALNNTLYHYRDLEAFNIVYQPGEVKTVILRSNRTFAPLLHMEIGDADPIAIRDILLEFVREDQDLLEPLVDIYARRLGF